jgi:hypothetical protein
VFIVFNLQVIDNERVDDKRPKGRNGYRGHDVLNGRLGRDWSENYEPNAYAKIDADAGYGRGHVAANGVRAQSKEKDGGNDPSSPAVNELLSH